MIPRTLPQRRKRNLPEFIDKLILIEYGGTEISIELEDDSWYRTIDWANLSRFKKSDLIDDICAKYTESFRNSGIDFQVVDVKIITRPLF